MPDSSAIGNALVAKLGADTRLIGILTNGVYFDVADEGLTRFAIVSLISGRDGQRFGARAFEDGLYQVEARVRGDTTADRQAAREAAARIDDLLDPQPTEPGGEAPRATLVVPGYALMTMYREEPIRFTERDEADPTILWHRRGGQYRVVMST
jgi:hypothetical protein